MIPESRLTCWLILIAGLLESERAERPVISGVRPLLSAAQRAQAGPQEVELTPVGRAEALGTLHS
jgi:hypothetical protein